MNHANGPTGGCLNVSVHRYDRFVWDLDAIMMPDAFLRSGRLSEDIGCSLKNSLCFLVLNNSCGKSIDVLNWITFWLILVKGMYLHLNDTEQNQHLEAKAIAAASHLMTSTSWIAWNELCDIYNIREWLNTFQPHCLLTENRDLYLDFCHLLFGMKVQKHRCW